MILELIGEALVALGVAAYNDHVMIPITNDGPLARICVFDPLDRQVMSIIVPHGETIRVRRGWRMIVEPVETVLLRPITQLSKQWEVM